MSVREGDACRVGAPDPSMDADGDGAVTVNELIVAVNNALHGCASAS